MHARGRRLRRWSASWRRRVTRQWPERRCAFFPPCTTEGGRLLTRLAAPVRVLPVPRDAQIAAREGLPPTRAADRRHARLLALAARGQRRLFPRRLRRLREVWHPYRRYVLSSSPDFTSNTEPSSHNPQDTIPRLDPASSNLHSRTSPSSGWPTTLSSSNTPQR